MVNNGRYTHIEDVLCTLHSGQWFGWTDSKNKIYENLVIHDQTKEKPTEKELTDALAEQQSDFDAQEYARNRKVEYDALNQFELISDDDANGTTSHKDAITAIKTKWPKDNSGPV